jgi:hypothetical protein
MLVQRFIVGAAVAALTSAVLSGVPADAQVLTAVKPGSLLAHTSPPQPHPPHGTWLTGLLQQVTTCGSVALERAPTHLLTYRAVRYEGISKRGACGQIVFWKRAAVAVLSNAKFVRVQAANGTFTVPVH